MRTPLAGALLAASAFTSTAAHAESINAFLGPILATAPDAAIFNARCDKIANEIQRRQAELEGEKGPATIDGTLRRYDDINGLIQDGIGEFGLYQEVMADDPRRI